MMRVSQSMLPRHLAVKRATTKEISTRERSRTLKNQEQGPGLDSSIKIEDDLSR